MLESPLDDISRQLSNVQKSMASVRRVMELFDTESRIKSPTGGWAAFSNLQDDQPLALQFDHVSFHNEDQRQETHENGEMQTTKTN